MIQPTERSDTDGQPLRSPAVIREGDVVMLQLGEQLIVPGRQDLRDAVLEELDKGERKFLIDFSRTGYIDSAGLGVLISISKQIRAVDGELALANLNEDLRSLFHLTKLDTLFGIIEPGSDKAGAPIVLRSSAEESGTSIGS